MSIFPLHCKSKIREAFRAPSFIGSAQLGWTLSDLIVARSFARAGSSTPRKKKNAPEDVGGVLSKLATASVETTSAAASRQVV
jgi:hypothetical protein